MINSVSFNKLTFSSPERYRVWRVPGIPKLLRLSENSKNT